MKELNISAPHIYNDVDGAPTHDDVTVTSNEPTYNNDIMPTNELTYDGHIMTSDEDAIYSVVLGPEIKVEDPPQLPEPVEIHMEDCMAYTSSSFEGSETTTSSNCNVDELVCEVPADAKAAYLNTC